MFLPNNAVPHQGSYSLPIVLFALLSACMEYASKWAIVVILGLQGMSFVSTWAIAGDQVGGTANGLAIALAILAMLVLAAVTVRCAAKDRVG